jgi:hypothetical protein
MQTLEGHSYWGRLPGCAGAICLMCGGTMGKHFNIIKEPFFNFCMYMGHRILDNPRLLQYCTISNSSSPRDFYYYFSDKSPKPAKIEKNLLPVSGKIRCDAWLTNYSKLYSIPHATDTGKKRIREADMNGTRRTAAVVSRSQTTTQIFKNDSRFLFVLYRRGFWAGICGIWNATPWCFESQILIIYYVSNTSNAIICH